MRGEAGELVLGRYRLEHPVGEGGFGCVWRGRQLALERPVAVKATRAAKKDDEATAERFRREALLVAGIVHPNVVTYHDFGIDGDGDRVLVMELLDGMSLLDVLRRGRPTPLADVVRWVGEAAAGLAEAHARGLVHRDVKPSNLFLAAPGTRAERLKVIDFGIVRADPRAHPGLRQLTRTDAVIGTPEYLAPEALVGRPLDGRADQYALALVAYELLALKRPFPPADRGGLLERMSERPPGLDFAASGRRVPPGVSAALWRALSPAPGDRFPTVVAFADALSASVDGFDEDGHGDRTRAGGGPGDTTRTGATRPGPSAGAGAPEDDRAASSEGADAAPAKPPRGILGAWPWVVAAVAALALGAGGALAWRGLGALAAGGGAGKVDAWVATDAVADGVMTDAEVTDAVADGVAADVLAADVVPADVVSADPAALDAGPVVAAPPRAVAPPARMGAVARTVRAPADPAVAAAVAQDPPVPLPASAAAAGADATLVLNAFPYADAFVDGRPVGRTPLRGVRVSPGRHEVVFRNLQKGQVVQVVEVGPGEERRLPTAFREAGVSPGATPGSR